MPGPDRWWAARDGLPTMVTALLTFTMLFATASCSNSDDDEAMRRIESGGFDSLELSGGQLNEALRDASDYQRQVLIDGTLTFAEYEAAVFSTIGCLEEKGIQVSSIPRSGKPPAERPELTSRGRWLYLARLPEGADGPTLQATIDACKNAYSSVVESLWFQQTLVTQSELQAARAEIARCLKQAGFEVPTNPGVEELRKVAFPPDGASNGRQPPPEYLACSQRVAEEYDLGASFIG